MPRRPSVWEEYGVRLKHYIEYVRVKPMLHRLIRYWQRNAARAKAVRKEAEKTK